MRIQIHAGQGPRPADDCPPPPPPLARLSPNGELVLVELQGSLEMDGVDPEGGQTIGVLRFPEGREDKPVLQISHHLLEGKIVTLPRPIAVLEKRVTQAGQDESDIESDDDAGISPPTSPAPASPSQLAKRARIEPPSTPTKPRDALSSSPMPERAPRYSDGHLDFSSPQPGHGKKPSTVTSYHVVTLSPLSS
ncbi:hypothetical protein MBRA1_000968 [Malassezia brasiliensis]|uniref:Chromosome transmission fidelity protein 8 n=1 Tax=Malassezia brasiliensis TaxID=1821822 RepID=A0AAF0IRW2_9BASI|nr:hypothetical protein MBRA1_000968 [Malassezia brasiliensis]